MDEMQLGESNLFLSPTGELIVKPLENMKLNPTHTMSTSLTLPSGSSNPIQELTLRQMNLSRSPYTPRLENPSRPRKNLISIPRKPVPLGLPIFSTSASQLHFKNSSLHSPNSLGIHKPVKSYPNSNKVHTNVSIPWIKKNTTITSENFQKVVSSSWVPTSSIPSLESATQLIQMDLGNLYTSSAHEASDPLAMNDPSPGTSKNNRGRGRPSKAERKAAKKKERKAQRKRIREEEALRNGPQRACKRPKTIKYFDNNDSESDEESDSSDDSFVPEEELRERERDSSGESNSGKRKKPVSTIPSLAMASASPQGTIRDNSIISSSPEVLIDPTKSVAKQVKRFYHNNPSQAIVQPYSSKPASSRTNIVNLTASSLVNVNKINNGHRYPVKMKAVRVHRPRIFNHANSANTLSTYDEQPLSSFDRIVSVIQENNLAIRRLESPDQRDSDMWRRKQNLNTLRPVQDHVHYLCGFCGEKFSTKEAMLIHKAESHSEAPMAIPRQSNSLITKSLIPCPSCDTKFLTDTGLERHVKRNHPNVPNLAISSTSKALESKACEEPAATIAKTVLNQMTMTEDLTQELIEMDDNSSSDDQAEPLDPFENDEDDKSVPMGFYDEECADIDMNDLLQVHYSDPEDQEEFQNAREVEKEYDKNDLTAVETNENDEEFILPL